MEEDLSFCTKCKICGKDNCTKCDAKIQTCKKCGTEYIHRYIYHTCPECDKLKMDLGRDIEWEEKEDYESNKISWVIGKKNMFSPEQIKEVEEATRLGEYKRGIEKEKKEKHLELLKSLIYAIVRKKRGELKYWEFNNETERIEEELKKYL